MSNSSLYGFMAGKLTQAAPAPQTKRTSSMPERWPIVKSGTRPAVKARAGKAARNVVTERKAKGASV